MKSVLCALFALVLIACNAISQEEPSSIHGLCTKLYSKPQDYMQCMKDWEQICQQENIDCPPMH